MNRFALLLFVLVGSLFFGTPFADASASPRGKVFLTVDEALKLAFPRATTKKETLYLTKQQHESAKKAAGVAVPSAVVRPYVAKDAKGNTVGTAWFDTHMVRSKKETIMIVVSPKETVERIEILSFGEPVDYIPGGKWYAQFTGKKLGPELSLKKSIRNVTGATLTAEATTEAVRRVLALHQVAFAKPVPKPKPKPVTAGK